MTTATKRRGSARTTVDAAVLLKAILAVRPAVARDGTGRHVLLADRVEACNGALRITEAVTVSTTPVLVPQDRLAKILSTVSGSVEIEVSGTTVRIRAARGEWTLPTESADEWPAVTDGVPRPFARFPADQFRRAVKSVIAATDGEASRYALGGMLLEHKGPHVAFVATDGRRLNCAVLDLDQDTDDGAVIVPEAVMKVLAEAAKDAGDEAMQIEIVGNREIVAECGNRVVRASLLDGRFPRWLDVIPEKIRPRFGDDDDTHQPRPPHATAAAGELLAAMRQAAIVTSDQSKGVLCAFTPKGLMIEGRSAEHGESRVTCDLGEAALTVQVRLDPQFARDWLQTVDVSAMVEIHATDAESAVTLRHEDTYAVIMPMAAE
jgi:DNA polymerase-3 subunit beta